MQALIDSVGTLSAKERKALAILLKEKGINLFGIAPICSRGADDPRSTPELIGYPFEDLGCPGSGLLIPRGHCSADGGDRKLQGGNAERERLDK